MVFSGSTVWYSEKRPPHLLDPLREDYLMFLGNTIYYFHGRSIPLLIGDYSIYSDKAERASQRKQGGVLNEDYFVVSEMNKLSIYLIFSGKTIGLLRED